jgi:3-dehydroquinate synthase
LAGFVAATFMRGIPYIQIPTSLLAQVDSSVGGKVAVDHQKGKNLIGAFHQPSAVYIDVSMLKTLPMTEFRNGMAEVIKYGAIMDKKLFSLLEKRRKDVLAQTPSLLEDIVSRCCALKARIVEQDERESGLRRILNFGHTIGHAVELLSTFSLRHGEAISIGMSIEAKIAAIIGLIPAKDADRLVKLLKAYTLPTTLPRSISNSSLINATATDKKVVDGAAEYTLLHGIGKAEAGVRIPAGTMLQLLAVTR